MAPQNTPALFPAFDTLNLQVDGVRFAGVTGGSGPPLLLLHGYPETHIAWRKVAPRLADSHTVVVPDLPGYGASRLLSSAPRWTKRRVASALAALMAALGHPRFAVAGHDRGARAGYRLALDHPERVAGFVSLGVVPILDALEQIDHGFALRTSTGPSSPRPSRCRNGCWPSIRTDGSTRLSTRWGRRRATSSSLLSARPIAALSATRTSGMRSATTTDPP